MLCDVDIIHYGGLLSSACNGGTAAKVTVGQSINSLTILSFGRA